jgi:hypothetical protein
MVNEKDDAFNGEFSLEKMTPEQRGEWAANQICNLNADKISYDDVLKAIALGVVWPNDEYILVRAGRHGHTRLFEPLAKSGLDIDEEDDTGYTALTHASKRGNIESVAELLRLKANLVPKGALEFDTDTPLETATYKRNIQIMKMLLKAGAPLWVNKKSGQSHAIAYAINRHTFSHTDNEEQHETIKTLLEAGTDPEVMIPNRYTEDKVIFCSALECARQTGYEPTIKLLEEHIALKRSLEYALANGLPVKEKVTAPNIKILRQKPKPKS